MAEHQVVAIPVTDSTADRIEALVRDLEEIADPHARERSEELVRSLMELYGSGLARVMDIVHESGAGDLLFDRFARDGFVSSLLILHGLHPVSVEGRVNAALERLRPTLAAHGGEVTLVSVAESGVRVRLLTGGHTCQSSAATIRQALERAIHEAAPEVLRVDVETPAPPPQLLQIARSKPLA